MVWKNIMHNLPFAEKIPLHKEPQPVTYLMDGQVFIGIDLVTGYICVEGCPKLYYDLFLYRGLDEKDLENFYLVSEYVHCAKLQNKNIL